MIDNPGTILSRSEIIDRLTDPTDKKIIISPILSSKQLQPASIDVRLGTDFLVIKTGKLTHMDPLKDPVEMKHEIDKYTEKYKILNRFEKFVLHPNEFVLGSTLEYIRLPCDIAARVEGRSSWARHGISIHKTAGFVDPGFSGNLTYEIINGGKVPVEVYPGIRIAQLAFFRINDNDINNTYKGKYNESFGVVASKYFEDPEFKRMRKLYYNDDKLIDSIFEAVENNTGIPQTDRPSRIPQRLVEAIERKYRERRGG